VLGVILLLGITISLTTAVIVIGTAATAETSGELGVGRAEKTLTQLDSKSAMVALGSTSRQSVPLAITQGASYKVKSERGWMNVTITNRTSDKTTTLVNATLGAIVYESDDVTVAYQGGGVWKETESGTTMLSPPEFHYRSATLTLPIIAVDGQSSLSSASEVTHLSTAKKFPNQTLDDDWRNPLTKSKVNVTVGGEYYASWGRYFEQRTDGTVYFNHSAKTVTVALVTPPEERTVSKAIVATSGGGEIRVSGDGSRTDSYNSSDGGTYASTEGKNGTLATAGKVYVGGDGVVNGTIRSGKSVKVTGSGLVRGDVYWTTGEQIKTSQVTGEIDRINGVGSEAPITTFVDNRIDDLQTENNNTETSVIDGEELDFSGTATLGPGSYYLKNLTVQDGNSLELDTDGKNISIAVEDYVRLDDGQTIEVLGGGRVNVFVGGEDSDPISKADFTIFSDGGKVQVPQENSTQFWLYGKTDFEASIQGSSSTDQRFEGVVFAPGGSTGSSSFEIKHGEVFGGVVTATVRLSQGGAVHYDQALAGTEVLPKDAELLQVTYLHVTVNEIKVDNG